MSIRLFKLLISSVFAALMLLACGGESVTAPAGVSVTPAESSVTVTWKMDSGVEYWLFYGPTSLASTNTTTLNGWIGLPGGSTLVNVSSPYVVTGLVNGTSYSFSINGRTDGGPGGPGSVAVAATPRIAGAVWTAGQAVSAADLRSVASNASQYLAVGVGGAMYSSTDGSAWSSINYATASNLNGANFFGDYRVVGDGGLIMASSDAITWTPHSSGTTKKLYAVTSNSANMNVVVGEGGTILSNLLSTTWTAATHSGTTKDLYGVTFGFINSVATWVAVGAGGTIITSTDALTWTAANSNTTANLRGIAYGSSTATGLPMWVAVGDGGTAVSSPDGITWTAQTTVVTTRLNAVSYGTQFVVVGDAGRALFSTDGTTWAAASTATGNPLYAVVRGPYVYSAVGATGTNLLSK